MTYTYDAGAETPVAAGMVEILGPPVARRRFGGRQNSELNPSDDVQMRINNGTFITNSISGLQETPPLRMAEQGLAADHGDYLSQGFYGGRSFAVQGTVRADTHQDLDDAVQQLMSVWSTATLTSGLTVRFRRAGWGEGRRAVCRLADSIVVEQPEQGSTKRPWKDFLLPLRSPDPRLYSETETVVDIGPGATKSLTSIGNFDTPMVLDFYGPFTSLSLISDGTSESIAVSVAVPSGDYIRIRTDEKTAIRWGNGSNWYGNVNGSFFNLKRGGMSLRAVATGSTSGSTKVRATYRAGWI